MSLQKIFAAQLSWPPMWPRDHCNIQHCSWCHKRMQKWLQCEVRHTCTCLPSRFGEFLGWRLRNLGREAAAPEAAYTAWGYFCIWPLQHKHNRKHNDRLFVHSLIVCSCSEPFKRNKSLKLTVNIKALLLLNGSKQLHTIRIRTNRRRHVPPCPVHTHTDDLLAKHVKT